MVVVWIRLAASNVPASPPFTSRTRFPASSPYLCTCTTRQLGQGAGLGTVKDLLEELGELGAEAGLALLQSLQRIPRQGPPSLSHIHIHLRPPSSSSLKPPPTLMVWSEAAACAALARDLAWCLAASSSSAACSPPSPRPPLATGEEEEANAVLDEVGELLDGGAGGLEAGVEDGQAHMLLALDSGPLIVLAYQQSPITSFKIEKE